MLKKSIILLVAISLIFISTVAFAQPESKVKPAMISPTVKAKIDFSAAKLKEIEATFTKIETQRLVKLEDAERIHKVMNEYAESMIAAFNEAIKDAEEAAKSEGKRGSVETLKFFEDKVKAHVTTLKRLEGKANAMEQKFSDGTIKLDKPLLQKLSPTEFEDVRRSLKPMGIKEMEKLHPDLFIKPMRPGASLNLFERSQATSSINVVAKSFPEQIGNFFVSPAEAKVAAPCIEPCSARRWSECAACIVGKGPEAKRCVDDFRSCWENNCKWYKPWWCAWCIAKLVDCLA